MINKIYFDADETLIYTMINKPDQDHVQFILDGDSTVYHTIIRPCSHELIRFARELVGKENVHILTTATRDYAESVNRLAGWGFDPKDIFAREDQHKMVSYTHTAYGGYQRDYTPHEYANPNNVLIDNLFPRENEGKIAFIGINQTFRDNYMKIDDYYGVNFPEDPFEQDVKEFLTARHAADKN